jgi:hypothetical protein
VRHLHSPTLAQWGCRHSWKTTTSRLGNNNVVRMRYLTCRRCGLRVKTEERLAVPWTEQALVALVISLLPEGQPIDLCDRGITELPLAGINAILAQQGYVIHASKVREGERVVACTDQDGGVEHFGVFELRRVTRQQGES